MDPVFAMEFLYCLSYTSQDFLSFRRRKVWIVLHQGKQGAPEVGINQNAFFLVAIGMHPKPAGARKLSCEA